MPRSTKPRQKRAAAPKLTPEQKALQQYQEHRQTVDDWKREVQLIIQEENQARVAELNKEQPDKVVKALKAIAEYDRKNYEVAGPQFRQLVAGMSDEAAGRLFFMCSNSGFFETKPKDDDEAAK